jgi:Uma2 family endonuclease
MGNMVVQLLRKKFTVAEFQQMAETGIIKDDDRVELLEGEIIEMGKIGSRHAAFVDHLNDLFREKLGRRVLVRIQNPIQVGSYSQPQPDVALVRRRDDYYEEAHPSPLDVFLLVEVADTTIESDREIKIPLYGRSGILETWLINLNETCVEVYRQPSPDGYQQEQKLLPGQIIIPDAFPNIQVMVNEIFRFC